MDGLAELYQEVIIDHSRAPRNFYKLDDANYFAEGYNPLCGDKLTLYLKVNSQKIIEKISFEGSGCAISTASASLMTQILVGKNLSQAEQLFSAFHELVTSDKIVDEELLGKLSILSGVKNYPSRVKCATLAWHTLQSALKENDDVVTTE